MTKVKAIALALFVAGFCASYALADNGHGKGHGKGDDTTSTSTSTVTTDTHGKAKGKDASACKPNVAFVLNGTFVSAGSVGSFSMTVTHANHHAKALGSPVTLGTDAKTSVRKNGRKVTVGDLAAGDRLNVQARGCKHAPAGTTTAQTLVAKRVVAHPAASEDGETTTTTAETETETNP